MNVELIRVEDWGMSPWVGEVYVGYADVDGQKYWSGPITRYEGDSMESVEERARLRIERAVVAGIQPYDKEAE